jgi:hypothetical protein
MDAIDRKRENNSQGIANQERYAYAQFLIHGADRTPTTHEYETDYPNENSTAEAESFEQRFHGFVTQL